MRWIWSDKFVEFPSGTSATAIKNVSLAEEHLHDLHPAFPIMPHSLIIEGMAQTAGILVGAARQSSEKRMIATTAPARGLGVRWRTRAKPNNFRKKGHPLRALPAKA